LVEKAEIANFPGVTAEFPRTSTAIFRRGISSRCIKVDEDWQCWIFRWCSIEGLRVKEFAVPGKNSQDEYRDHGSPTIDIRQGKHEFWSSTVIMGGKINDVCNLFSFLSMREIMNGAARQRNEKVEIE
jgi:hypothetical protein